MRLPVYQRILAELVRTNVATVSSEQLASLAAVNAAKVRKDLSLLGSFGTRGSGYDPAYLIDQIERALGVDKNWTIAVVGIGNLGRALTNSEGFASRGFNVTAHLRRRPRGHRGRDQGPAGTSHGRDRLPALDGAARHRGHHHPWVGRPGGGQPAGGGRRDLPA